MKYNSFCLRVSAPFFWVVCSFILSHNLYAEDESEIQPEGQTEASVDISRCNSGGVGDVGDSVAIKPLAINIHPVFDESIPAENNWLFRLVNRLHIDTRESVIKNDLLIKEGDVFDEKLLAESERILRTRRYLNKAAVTADAPCGTVRRVNVDVHQVWTLVPELGFSHSGGNSNFSFGLHDSNFLGYGKTVNITHTSSAERASDLFEYYDPNTGMYDSVFKFDYANNSDGKRQALVLIKPFFALNTDWSAGMSYENFDQEDTLYDAGDEVERFGHSGDSQTFFYGKKLNGASAESVHRLLFGYTAQQDDFFTLNTAVDELSVTPDNRQFNYPWLEYQYIEDGFIEAYNIQQINRVEDINLGAQAHFRLGYSSSIYPENDGSYVFNGDYSKGFSLSEHQLLLADFSADGIYGDTGLYNTVVKGSLSYHWQNFDRGQLYVEFTRAQGFHLFADQPLELGGDTGLRGYPARYQAGDRMQLFSVEQRFFGEREWFSLFHMGAAIFYDEGQVWGESAIPQSQQGRLRDVGIGLRISGTRTGGSEAGAHNVLHIDLASPLDGGQDISQLQWLIKVKKSF